MSDDLPFNVSSFLRNYLCQRVGNVTIDLFASFHELLERCGDVWIVDDVLHAADHKHGRAAFENGA